LSLNLGVVMGSGNLPPTLEPRAGTMTILKQNGHSCAVPTRNSGKASAPLQCGHSKSISASSSDVVVIGVSTNCDSATDIRFVERRVPSVILSFPAPRHNRLHRLVRLFQALRNNTPFKVRIHRRVSDCFCVWTG